MTHQTVLDSERLAQAQLDAYNQRDIHAFAACYADDVEFVRLPSGEVFCSGRDEVIQRYGSMFEEHPGLHCELVRRIVCGDFCYDEERVSGLVVGAEVHAVATYFVQDSLIRKAWFVRA